MNMHSGNLAHICERRICSWFSCPVYPSGPAGLFDFHKSKFDETRPELLHAWGSVSGKTKRECTHNSSIDHHSHSTRGAIFLADLVSGLEYTLLFGLSFRVAFVLRKPIDY